jgi:hypothetical protein
MRATLNSLLVIVASPPAALERRIDAGSHDATPAARRG